MVVVCVLCASQPKELTAEDTEDAEEDLNDGLYSDSFARGKLIQRDKERELRVEWLIDNENGHTLERNPKLDRPTEWTLILARTKLRIHLSSLL
jgi:hypothetical protein